jgi:energy-coupling factor transporter ATP-binding protein EcfA2
MVNLIIGNKGSGKTKKLIEHVNNVAASSEGSVVCVEKERKLTYDISNQVRLLDTDAYAISGYDQFYGFLSGICAGNYDITDISIDATLKIGGRDYEALETFLKKIDALSIQTNIDFTFTVSTDKSELPEGIFDFAKEV